MAKPKSLRMKLHEMNRPPEYLQAYPAEEMDAYLDELQARADGLAELMEWFCHRVEIGEVRSKTTYARFRAALGKED
jgi:hypothetical protein